jgi:hypothetical protein
VTPPPAYIRYTKALDNIKSIKKEAAIELKVDKEKYAALVVDKNRAEKVTPFPHFNWAHLITNYNNNINSFKTPSTNLRPAFQPKKNNTKSWKSRSKT